MPSFSVCRSRWCIGVGDSVLDRCVNTLIHLVFITLVAVLRLRSAAVRLRGGRLVTGSSFYKPRRFCTGWSFISGSRRGSLQACSCTIAFLLACGFSDVGHSPSVGTSFCCSIASTRRVLGVFNGLGELIIGSLVVFIQHLRFGQSSCRCWSSRFVVLLKPGELCREHSRRTMILAKQFGTFLLFSLSSCFDWGCWFTLFCLAFVI